MVYIELIILTDLIIHHVFVYATSLFLFIRVKCYRLLISDIFNLLLLWLYIRYHILLPVQVILIIVICYITFHKQKIKASLLYLAFNMMLGGLAEILYLGGELNWYLLLIILSALLILIITYKVVFKKIKDKALIYQMIIIERKKRLVLDVYLDTGNFMQDEHNNPVIIVNNKYKKIFKRKDSMVLCQTVNNTSFLPTYKFDNAYIKLDGHYIEVDGTIVFSNIAFEGMIGLDILGGNNV